MKVCPVKITKMELADLLATTMENQHPEPGNDAVILALKRTAKIIRKKVPDKSWM